MYVTKPGGMTINFKLFRVIKLNTCQYSLRHPAYDLDQEATLKTNMVEPETLY